MELGINISNDNGVERDRGEWYVAVCEWWRIIDPDNVHACNVDVDRKVCDRYVRAERAVYTRDKSDYSMIRVARFASL